MLIMFASFLYQIDRLSTLLLTKGTFIEILRDIVEEFYPDIEITPDFYDSVACSGKCLLDAFHLYQLYHLIDAELIAHACILQLSIKDSVCQLATPSGPFMELCGKACKQFVAQQRRDILKKTLIMQGSKSRHSKLSEPQVAEREHATPCKAEQLATELLSDVRSFRIKSNGLHMEDSVLEMTAETHFRVVGLLPDHELIHTRQRYMFLLVKWRVLFSLRDVCTARSELVGRVNHYISLGYSNKEISLAVAPLLNEEKEDYIIVALAHLNRVEKQLWEQAKVVDIHLDSLQPQQYFTDAERTLLKDIVNNIFQIRVPLEELKRDYSEWQLKFFQESEVDIFDIDDEASIASAINLKEYGQDHAAAQVQAEGSQLLVDSLASLMNM